MIKETRLFEIRKFSQDEGTFDAYVATWGVVDSFGTRFKRGAFRKTIQERMKRGDIKVLWQHQIGEPIGVVLDAKEDEHGLLIHARLDQGVPRADQARAQMDSGTINQMSFGFDIIKQKRNPDDGFIDISEVRWWEASPVTFGANPETSIENVRSTIALQDDEIREADDGKAFTEIDGAIELRALPNEEKDNGVDEPATGSLPSGDSDGSPDNVAGSSSSSRATDFDDTLHEDELNSRGWRILEAFWWTISDIWYSGEKVDVINALDETFEKAHAAYLEWAQELIEQGQRSTNIKDNELTQALDTHLDGRSLDEAAADSKLSIDELKSLSRGELLPLEARGRLAEFSGPVAEAHAKQRAKVVYSLFQEIRAKGFSQAEKVRLRALLPSGKQEQDGEPANEQMLTDALDFVRSNF